MHATDVSPFERLKAASAEDWRAYCQHDFVRQLGAGTLPREAFRHYLEQDYLFLVHFARAWGLAVYKSRTITELRQGLDMLKAIVDVELGLHIDYCRQWGVAEDDLMRVPEARARVARSAVWAAAGKEKTMARSANAGGRNLMKVKIRWRPCLARFDV